MKWINRAVARFGMTHAVEKPVSCDILKTQLCGHPQRRKLHFLRYYILGLGKEQIYQEPAGNKPTKRIARGDQAPRGPEQPE
jgi:hypothetical protein